METKKRDRSANFSNEETRILVDLILKYKHIIENKKTDAITWKQKDAGWTRLTTEFNCQLSKNRTTKMLKIKYEGLKRALKKKKQTNARELFKTAGGSPILIPYTDYEEKLLSVLLLSVEGLSPEADSDANLVEPNFRCTAESIADVGDGFETAWKVWTPGYLRTPISGKLKTQARKAGKQDIMERFSTIADQRGVILETQKLLAEKELEIKEK
ncbi:Myb/SANT-like DNA-binding domain, partial [Popillia japonica]